MEVYFMKFHMIDKFMSFSLLVFFYNPKKKNVSKKNDNDSNYLIFYFRNIILNVLKKISKN